MARSRSIPKITGRVADLVFYRGEDGKILVRTLGNMTRERFYTDPKFEASRRANTYLAMASKAGAGLRQALAPYTKSFCDRKFTRKLVSICHSSLRQHHSDQLPPSFSYQEAARLLEGMPLSEGKSVFSNATRITIDQAEQNNNIHHINIEGWTLSLKDIAKAGATHLRWTVITAPIPYDPNNPIRNKVVESPWFEIDTINPRNSQPWACTINTDDLKAKGKEIVIALAFETAQKTVQDYYPLETNKAMNILKILQLESEASGRRTTEHLPPASETNESPTKSESELESEASGRRTTERLPPASETNESCLTRKENEGMTCIEEANTNLFNEFP